VWYLGERVEERLESAGVLGGLGAAEVNGAAAGQRSVRTDVRVQHVVIAAAVPLRTQILATSTSTSTTASTSHTHTHTHTHDTIRDAILIHGLLFLPISTIESGVELTCPNVRSKADMSQLNLPHGNDN